MRQQITRDDILVGRAYEGKGYSPKNGNHRVITDIINNRCAIEKFIDWANEPDWTKEECV